MSRPVVLLPSSKGTADGGEGPSYGDTVDVDHPLADARRELLAAVRSAADAADRPTFARLTGLGERAETQRAHHAGLDTQPTLPAHRRFTGIVHSNAGLQGVVPDACPVDVRIVSALLGLAELHDPVPDHRLELGATLPGIGGITTFWRRHLADHLRDVTAGVRVWNLLPSEHARVWPADRRGGTEVIDVRFVRPDGGPANAARAKVCKGLVTAAILRLPEASPRVLARRADVGEGWVLAAGGDTLTATYHG